MDTVRSLLAEAASGPSTGDDTRRDAQILLQHVVGRDRSWLIAHDTEHLHPDQASRFRSLWARRLTGEPIAYLTGWRGFWKLDLAVTPDVLIPRPETELLVEVALAGIPEDTARDLADLGTGSGAVALSLALERPACRVLATDCSTDALAVARANARAHGIGNVDFRQGSWCEALAGHRFHMIVSNPPYISVTDPHLARGDVRFEPRGALESGADGLDDLRRIIATAPAHLVADGILLLEHGYDQGEAVRTLLREAGFADIRTWRDLGGRERVTGGKMNTP